MFGLLEIRRNRAKFTLLTFAVALIAFLMIFLSALSVGLIQSITGAINGLKADALVYSADARGNMQTSRITPGQLSQISALPGVASASPVATTTVSTTEPLSNDSDAVQVFTTTTGDQAGAAQRLVDGQLPTSAGQAAVDASGVEIGSTITIKDGPTLTVVGILKGAQFAALPTAYTTFDTYSQIFRQVNPVAVSVPTNAVAVTAQPGVTTVTLQNEINSSVAGVESFTISDAAAAIPGAESITQTFGILILLALVSGVMVVGFFFLILTVQKMRTLTVLRAIGASGARLGGALFLQITVAVLVGGALGAFGAVGALGGLSAAIPVTVSPALAIGCVVAVWLGSCVAGAISLRRILRIEPALAVGGVG